MRTKRTICVSKGSSTYDEVESDLLYIGHKDDPVRWEVRPTGRGLQIRMVSNIGGVVAVLPEATNSMVLAVVDGDVMADGADECSDNYALKVESQS